MTGDLGFDGVLCVGCYVLTVPATITPRLCRYCAQRTPEELERLQAAEVAAWNDTCPTYRALKEKHG